MERKSMAESEAILDREEVARCATDFSYFCENHIKTVHPKKGLIPLILHEYQRRLGKHLDDNKFTLVKKFRQGGFTTMTVAYMLWTCMFKIDQNVMFFSKSDREACNIGYLAAKMI